MQGLRVADLAFCPELDDPVVSALAQCCPRLEDVSLRGCAMGNDGVMALIQHCVELRSLDISVWPHERLRNVNTITDVALFFLAQVAALRGSQPHSLPCSATSSSGTVARMIAAAPHQSIFCFLGVCGT